MSRISISYLRKGYQTLCGRLCDRLAQLFGKDLVLRDIDAIDPGAKFSEVIGDRVGGRDVHGAKWLDANDGEGRLRLDLPRDFVKAEIAAALDQCKPVTPGLIEATTMPSCEAHPEGLLHSLTAMRFRSAPRASTLTLGG